MGQAGGLTARLRRRPMTVDELSDLIVGLGAVCGALMLIGALLWRIVVRPLRRSLSEELEPVITELEKVKLGQEALNTRMSDHIMTHGQN